MNDPNEPDRLEGFPHPRERAGLIGHSEAERAFLDAYRSGRLHHAWIIGGPEGIGKATLAYRIARFLLAHPDPSALAVRNARDLAVDPGQPAARQVAAQSHPDLFVLRRTINPERKGSVFQEIPVSMARDANALFESTAGEGGWRVCIVDSMEEMNRHGANALLKTLEEPPKRAIFLIVSHAPGRLMPTIRSRCRRLDLAPLSHDDIAAIVGELADGDAAAIATAAADARGSVRRALALLDPDLAAMGARTRALLDAMPNVAQRDLIDLAGRASGRDGEALYGEMLDAVREWLSERVEQGATLGAARLEPLADVWERLHEGARTVDEFNLDKRPFIVGLFSDMADAVARMRAA